MRSAVQFTMTAVADPLKGEDVTEWLTDVSQAEQGATAVLPDLAPVVLAGRTIQGLVLEGQTITRHVDFTGATFVGDTSFKGTSFLAGVSFFKAIFRGLAEFDGAIFDGINSTELSKRSREKRSVYEDLLPRLSATNFDHATFVCGATFIGTIFRVRTLFKYSKFVGPAYFWRSRFDSLAFFQHIEVEPTPADRVRHTKHEHRHVAEANFSYCLFKDSVDFSRAHFHGHTFFHRTVFLGNSVNFETVRFDDEIIFEGNQGDVCISRDDLSTEIQDHLLETHILCDNDDNDGFLNFGIHFDDPKALQIHLGKSLDLTEPQKDVVIKLWTKHSAPMFAPNTGANFKNLRLSSKSSTPQLLFSNVDLSNSGFRGTNLSRIQFLNVSWPEKDIFWRVTKRKVVYDELLLSRKTSIWSEIASELSFRYKHHGHPNTQTSRKKYAAISVLYQELRRVYASAGLLDEARDFYFGELEMARFALGVPRRWISLSFMYRLLSGYGRQEGLAFAWLVFFLVVLFPSVYWALNPLYDHWWAWPLSHSLRVATFLRDVEPATAGRIAPISPLTAFAEGFERIAIAVQASLFLIAVKWRFNPER